MCDITSFSSLQVLEVEGLPVEALVGHLNLRMQVRCYYSSTVATTHDHLPPPSTLLPTSTPLTTPLPAESVSV